jgi:hypothetical protein
MSSALSTSLSSSSASSSSPPHVLSNHHLAQWSMPLMNVTNNGIPAFNRFVERLFVVQVIFISFLI